MSDLLPDMVDYLILYASDAVTELGTDVFIDIMPDEPDDCVALIEYSGEVAFINNMLNRSIQVRVRNTDYATGKDKAIKIYNSVYDPESEVKIIDFTAGRWGIVKAREYPYLLNRDDSGRNIFTFRLGIVTVGDS